MNVQEMKAKHELLQEYSYDLSELERGYNNRTLYINLSDKTIKEKPVTEQMKEKFIGGKGFGLRLLWDGTKPDTKWNDPENEIIISPGPIAGITQYSGTGKSLVVSISPTTNLVIDSNVGGYFGPFLKFSGFDALEIQGKAEDDVIIIIDGTTGTISIEKAPEEAVDSHILVEQLTEMYADDEKDKRNISVVSAGSAAENTLIGMLNFSWYDVRRKECRIKQAGRGGIGTVFRNKNIKALVAKSGKIKPNMNNVVDLPAIMERGKRFTKEMRELDDEQSQMKQAGTAHLIEIMSFKD
jgi:aldehyde:ferredoxin oxidoreductase